MERRRLHRSRANRKRFQGRALKAEQCSPDEDRACTIIVLRETLDVRAAQPTLKRRAADSHPRLSSKEPGEP
jgi:hypothetical protein